MNPLNRFLEFVHTFDDHPVVERELFEDCTLVLYRFETGRPAVARVHGMGYTIHPLNNDGMFVIETPSCTTFLESFSDPDSGRLLGLSILEQA